MNGRYLAPPDPYENFEVGCLRVYYPDSPLLFRALRAQLTYLESRFVWHTGGDIDAAEKLEQDWLSAGALTFAAIGDGCPDTEDCEQTIIDLTIQLQQCQDYIQELENMEITVNCNCGCCNDYTVPTDPNGDPYPVIPVNPNDPLDQEAPTFDPVNQVPPDGYDTWQDFDADRCRAANWFVDSYIQFVKDADIAERKLSAGAAIMEVVALLLAALPGPVGDYAGVVVIIRWITRMVSILAEVVDELEDLNDWLQLAADEVEANKENLVCAAYSMTSPEWLKEFFATFFAGYVTPEMQSGGASATVITAVRDIFDSLFQGMADRVSDGFANQRIPEDYVAQYTCGNCAQAGGFTYVPMTVDSVLADRSHGSYATVDWTISADGSSVHCDVSPGIGFATAEFGLDDPGIQPSQVVGIAVTVQGENVNLMGMFRTLWSNLTGDSDHFYPAGTYHTVVGPNNQNYPSNLPGVDTIDKFDWLRLGAATGNETCDLTGKLSIAIGAGPAVDNTPFSFNITGMFWILDDSAACP